MKKTMRLLIFAGLLGLLNNNLQAGQQLNGQSQADAFQSIASIHELVMNHVKQKVGQKLLQPSIELRRLSPGLQLRSCQSQMQIDDSSPNDFAGRMTISVSCLNPKWRVFVPVNVDGMLPVVMTTKGILKKAVIKADEVAIQLIPYKKIPRGAMVDAQKAIGMRAKRAIGANEILKIRHLQPPYWVFKNQGVNIVTRISGIEVKTRGIALRNAVEGQQVTVENSKSKKTVKGIVIAPNTVLIP